MKTEFDLLVYLVVGAVIVGMGVVALVVQKLSDAADMETRNCGSLPSCSRAFFC